MATPGGPPGPPPAALAGDADDKRRVGHPDSSDDLNWEHDPPPPDGLEGLPLPPGLAGRRQGGPRRRSLAKPELPQAPLSPQQKVLLLDTWQRSGLSAHNSERWSTSRGTRSMPGSGGSRNWGRGRKRPADRVLGEAGGSLGMLGQSSMFRRCSHAQESSGGARATAEHGKERFWRGHIAGRHQAGCPSATTGHRHALSEPSFYAWRAELSRRGRIAARERLSTRTITGAAAQRTQRWPPQFVRLDVHQAGETGLIEIVLGNEGLRGTMVPVPQGADRTTLGGCAGGADRRASGIGGPVVLSCGGWITHVLRSGLGAD